MVVMGMGQHARVDAAQVYAQAFRVLSKETARACVQQDSLAVRVYQYAEALFPDQRRLSQVVDQHRHFKLLNHSAFPFQLPRQ